MYSVSRRSQAWRKPRINWSFDVPATTASSHRRRPRSFGSMCRNITTLRGLEPEATDEEIEAAARQFVRKVSGVQTSSVRTDAAVDKAVLTIVRATTKLLAELPPRRQPPPTLPPLRRIRARTG